MPTDPVHKPVTPQLRAALPIVCISSMQHPARYALPQGGKAILPKTTYLVSVPVHETDQIFDRQKGKEQPKGHTHPEYCRANSVMILQIHWCVADGAACSLRVLASIIMQTGHILVTAVGSFRSVDIAGHTDTAR